MKAGPSNKEDFLALLVRRRWWIIAPFLALSGATALFVYLLPSTYVSEVLIMVRPRDVPEAYVPDVVGTSEQRLAAIQRTILSRSELEDVLETFGGQLKGFDALNSEQRVVRLRNQIDINFQTEAGRSGAVVTSLHIAYQNQDARVAQAIAQDLTARFIREDNRDRESQVVDSREWLQEQLEGAAAELAVSEEELGRVRRANQNSLPEQRETNISTLDRLTLQQQTNTEATDRWATTLYQLQQQLSLTPQFLPPAEVEPVAVDPAVSEYLETRSSLDEMLARGRKETHPEVIAAHRLLERLAAQLPESIDLDAVVPDPPQEPVLNPEYQELTTQIGEARAELELREAEKNRITADIARYSGYVDQTFTTELLIAEIQRRNAALRENYDTLQAKFDSAELSERLEVDQRNARFDIVDTANLPDAPTKPNKLALLLGGVVGSLALAIAFAVGVDVARQKIWTQSEIETLWGVPVLVDIPEIITDADVAGIKKKQLTLTLCSVGATGGYAWCMYVFYANSPMILERLDPIIQRLVY